LPKQSGIGRAYEIAAEMPDQYPKETVFESYLNDPEFGPIIKQKNISCKIIFFFLLVNN
jgi:hypothetical protein